MSRASSIPVPDGLVLVSLEGLAHGERIDVLVLTAALRAGEHIVVHGVLADRRPDRDQVERAATAAGMDMDRVSREWLGWLADRAGVTLGRTGVLHAAHVLGVASATAIDAWLLGNRPAAVGGEAA